MRRLNFKEFRNIRVDARYIRIAGIVLATIFILLLIGGFIAYGKREALLKREIVKIRAKAKRDYNLDLRIGSATFSGLSTVEFSNLTVVPAGRDSLLSIQHFDVGIKMFPLLFGEVKLKDVVLQNGHLNLTDIHHIRNFDFLFKKKKDTTQHARIDLSELSYRLVNQVLYKIPDNLDLKNFLVSFKSDSASLNMLTTSAAIRHGQLSSTINVDNGRATWHVAGRMRPSDRDIDIKFYADGKKVEIPLLKKYRLKVSFDTLSTRLSKVDHSSGETDLSGYWGVKGLVVNHPALSSSDIVIPNAGIDADMVVGENYVSVDSTSLISLGKISAHPFIKYTLNPVKIYELKVNTGWMDAQDFFDSLPQGVFDSLEGMQAAGRLNYKLNILLNAAHPDDVQFDSRLDKDNFRIIRYGKVNLGKLNGTFVYTPYVDGKPMPSRIIGPQNPYYTPLEDISPYLQHAVMTAEDPSFYRNHGFVEESIRKSLAEDFKTKKFKRGGSTISMQLVKNTFLSQEKTLARKIEEILIVWMIENNHIMTKNRMLEVYFNIVEWGHNVYGIGEGSRYYFNKTPAQLNLGESIYMASIVPAPRFGLYSFQPDGTLRPGKLWYFNLIGNLMAANGYAAPDSTGYGFYDVRLKESLRKEAPTDTLMADSLMKQDSAANGNALPIMPQGEKKPSFIQRLFGKHDTTAAKKEAPEDPKEKLKTEIEKLRQDEKTKELLIDTAGKTRKEIRQEKRRLREEERQQEKALKDGATP